MSRRVLVLDDDFDVRAFRDVIYTLGDSTRKAASAVCVSPYAIYTWTSGTALPGAANIMRICAVSGVKADDLLQIPEDCRNVPGITGTTAEKIAQLIYEAGLSLSEAALAICGDDRPDVAHIMKWMNGKCAPAFGSIRRICKTFKVSADWLLNI